MQAELEAAYPMLDIQILGVNSVNQEVDFQTALADHSIPLLQDTDADGDGRSDAWALWQAEWRDVVIVDGLNEAEGVFNLTENDLAVPENYQQLRSMILQQAMADQRPWSNLENLLDVDDDGEVTREDAQRIIDTINGEGARAVPNGPNRVNVFPPGTPFPDTNMDGLLTPIDALLVLNEVNGFNGGEPTGEGEAAAADFALLTFDGSQPSQASAERQEIPGPGIGADAALEDDWFSTAVDSAAEAGDGGSRADKTMRNSADELPPLLDPLLVDLLLTSL